MLETQNTQMSRGSFLFIALTLALALVVAACGGEPTPEADSVGEASSSAAAESAIGESGSRSGGFDRESFVLCPVIEEHKEELASMAGFTADVDRSVQTFANECNVRGDNGSFVKVELAPAIMPSIEMYVEGYEDPTTAAPELGSNAVFVDSSFQPHVVFHMGDLIIDVGAQALETPDRAAMIQLARRVRELLTEANS